MPTHTLSLSLLSNPNNKNCYISMRVALYDTGSYQLTQSPHARRDGGTMPANFCRNEKGTEKDQVRDFLKFAALKTTCTGEMPTKLECKVKVEEAPNCSTLSCTTQNSTSAISSAAIDLSSNKDMVTTDKDLTCDVWVMHGKTYLKANR